MSVPPPVIVTFRDRIRALWSPPWLRNGNAEKLLYALAVQVDCVGEALVAGVQSRFPGYYSDESLKLIGAERRIARGPAELSGTYAVRLKRWLDDHRHRGGPYAMLEQLFAYYAPNNFAIDLYYRNGCAYSLDVNGNITRTPGTGFTPDDRPDQWARWWLFFYTDAFPSPGAEIIASLKLIPHDWNAAHCFGKIVVMPTGEELWNFPVGHTWNETGTWNTAGGGYTLSII